MREDRTLPTTRSSWRNDPPDGHLVPLDYTENFTPGQVALLSRGLLPLEMEDRGSASVKVIVCTFIAAGQVRSDTALTLRSSDDGGGTVRAAFTDAADPGAVETLKQLVHVKLLEEKPPMKVPLWRKLLGA